MANAVSYSKTGTKHEASVKLEPQVFSVEASHELVAQAYRTYLANGRVAGATTLKRGEVRGGGRKPWRQKGTGRARVGSIRVPNWRGGGITFGPSGNENHSLNLPVRMKRAAIRQSLSLRAEAGDIVVLEAFTSTDGKVKATVELLTKMKLEGTILLALEEKTNLTERATRNLQGLKAVSANYLNVFDIMNADKIVVTQKALDVIKSWLGEK
ncbi:MAG: ribosomal protein [Patescibacteria group bacterium]|jgi:large subunit ribosomal protein L4|nr:ribosomal protein [Patescibacteria group bacterium]